MVELTEREKKIVMIKFIMHGTGPYMALSPDDREKHLIAAMQLLGYDYNQDEMLDLGDAILAVQQDMIDAASGFLNLIPADVVKNAIKHSMSMFKR